MTNEETLEALWQFKKHPQFSPPNLMDILDKVIEVFTIEISKQKMKEQLKDAEAE